MNASTKAMDENLLLVKWDKIRSYVKNEFRRI